MATEQSKGSLASQTRKEKKEQTRQRIMEATKEVLATKGSNGFSMREVAKIAGIAQPSIYKHFANLAELFEALADEAKTQYIFPLQKVFLKSLSDAEADSLEDVMGRMYLFIIQAAKSRGYFYRMMVAECLQPNSEFGNHMVVFFEDLKNEWVKAILALFKIEHNAERELHYKIVVDAIFAMIDTFALGNHQAEAEHNSHAANVLAKFTIEMISEDFRPKK
ncbi:MAG: TetR/AcrR family transcriptional regulator [Pseudomonadales bacterium]|nr:TetR/AcrR family transcriptional regulator [Pseudomonadales bacterium]